MQIIKPSTLSLLKQTYDLQGHQFVVSALSFFQLGETPTLLDESTQWLRLQPYLSTGIILDTGHAKGRFECLLAGTAYAKEAKPVTQMMVQLKMGDVAKSVRVIGNRTCHSGGLLRSKQVSAPEPFIQMPLGDAESYGGEGFTENPQGKGVLNKTNFDREKDVYHLANLYLAEESIAPDKAKREVANFLPRELTHPQRAQYQGTYDQHWLDHTHPGLPDDTNPRLFNVAPPSQQQKTPFLPSEHYVLSGFHPEKSRIEGHLPNVLVRAFVTQEHHEHSDFIEISTHIDTVWFFPELELGIAIHRGVSPAYDSAGLDIKNLLLALENVEDIPRDKAYFQRVLKERLDPKTAAGHAFHASPLLPQHSEEETARRAKLYAQAQAEQEAKNAKQRLKLLKQMQSEHPELDWDNIFAQQKTRQNGMPELGPIPQELIDKKDFDLTPYIEFSRQQVQKAKEQMAQSQKALQAKLKQEPKPHEDEPQASLLARFSEVVLIQADEQVQQALPEAASAARKQAHAHQLMLKSQRRARQLSPHVNQPRHVSVAGAGLLRQQVLSCLAQGDSLAGRDLFGADLSGLDLRGQDLRDVMLERANLTHANLAGCLCDGVVLTEANLDGACFDGCRFTRANLSQVACRGLRCQQATFDHTLVIESHFEQGLFMASQFSKMQLVSSDFSSSDFSKSIWVGVQFIQSCLKETRWPDTQVSLCTFLECPLQLSQWQKAKLTRCAFLKTDVSHGNFSQIQAQKTQIDATYTCEEADFSHGHWEYCGFRNVSFEHCCFSASVFQHCDFSLAKLTNCALNQSLWHSCLLFQGQLLHCSGEQAVFYQSNLRKTRFSDSDLSLVTFHQTNMREVEFQHCHLAKMVRYPVPSLTA
ncbi:DUF2169 domain-containing protein [Vibrio gazogenes]|uniref:Pentapeptide repeat-containing protein n=1 Tax=Vibrio gazogenes DSM 21264 = NBRC 103151 TaxID=1123492 RepID=A0A1M4TH72_VIBGA|nr:DUF2169 domain-containing protein [Vibrio gazogenes]USP16093.1 DUF2169 domain-containing protein [Vibrio gazogenes]SHE43674.1 Pentapeptide repeat-containing protein [Vibrio gazogenes DSM 21264] [Vibrio gazogenes DSM 21264 = NBRC 103151]SJN54225.1 Pentapeptide repeats (8 copies) [Vibrio gazogenes]